MDKETLKQKVREKLSKMTLNDLEKSSDDDLRKLKVDISVEELRVLIAELRREKIKDVMRLVAEAAFTKREHPEVSEEHLVKEIFQSSKKKGH